MLKLQVHKELKKEKEHSLSSSRCIKSQCLVWMAYLIKEVKKLKNNEIILGGLNSYVKKIVIIIINLITTLKLILKNEQSTSESSIDILSNEFSLS